MKMIGSLKCGIVALGLLVAMAGSVTAQTVEQGVAKVVYIRGLARYMTEGTTVWRPLKTGTLVKPGTIIQTAGDSYVDLALNNPGATTGLGAGPSPVAYSAPKAEQDAVRIFENSVLGIDKLSVNDTGADRVTETQLDLRAGKILGTVKKMSADSRYEVKIPNGVAGIRGTVYLLSADGVLSVLSGSVVLSFVGPDGNVVTQVVGAGQQYDAKTGRVTNIPEGIRMELERIVSQLQSGPYVPPTTFTVDHTIYYVSPTVGLNE